MKLVLKILGILIALLVIAIITIPIIFKDDIVKMVKEESNNAVNAKIEFGDFDLSLIKNFPNFHFSIENVSVEGIAEFEGVYLAKIESLELVVDLMSVINGESIMVKNIAVVGPEINAKVLADGKANWDIAKASEEVEVEVEVKDESAAPFRMELEKITIEKGRVIYDDATFPMYMDMNDLNLVISGDMYEAITTIKADGGVESFSLTYDGVEYMKELVVKLDAALEADIENFKFTFKENKIMVNQLALGADGWVAMPNDPIDMDLTFEAKETEFKHILSLIPAAFAKDLEGVETSGLMVLNGYVKGTYVDSTFPGFGINLSVKDAMFNYPDLPKSVQDIQVTASVESKDGDLDHTIVDVPVFHLNVAKNPFDLNFYLATPMSDPFIRAGFKGLLVLDHIKDIVPLEKGDEMAGTITADVALEGNVSALEKEQYESFKALGNLNLKDFHYATDSLDYPIDISTASLSFSPKFVNLSEFSMQMGKSDISAQGKLENFIAYALKDNQTLRAELNMQSKLLDINELAGIDPNAAEETPSEETEAAAGEEEPMAVVLLPKNIDFVSNAKIDQLIFDNMSISNINGGINLKEEKLSLSNTNMNLLGGSMKITGFYETTDSLAPSYDFGMDIKNFDVQQTVTTFNTVKQMAPIAENCKGSYSTAFEIVGKLDNQMNPIYESMFGKGKMQTNSILVEDYKPLKKVAETIKYEKLNPLSLKDVNISFAISNGKVFVEPFTTKVGNSSVTISGSNSFDQTIDYLFNFAIPRAEFGGAANAALDGLLAQAAGKGVDIKVADVIKVDVRMTGPATDPKISTDFKQAKGEATNAIKEKVKEEFDKKKAELEAKAKEELEKQKKAAEDKAKQLIEEQKKKAQEELDKQKEEAKKKLEEEAKKKLKGLFGK